LDGPLPKLCSLIPTSNQDGCQAQNRKRGDGILIVHCCFSVSQNELKFEEISIFSNSGHLEWRAGLSDTILKGTHPGTIPASFGLIWFSGFRGEDLNVIFYQNMPNLHNRNFFKWPKLLYFKPECAQI
jgi:hypothetical protein